MGEVETGGPVDAWCLLAREPTLLSEFAGPKRDLASENQSGWLLK